jgi:hypothetical protein
LRKPPVLRPQEIRAHLGERVVAVGHEILAQKLGAFGRDRVYLGEAKLSARRIQTAIDVARVGAECDSKSGPYAVENRLEPRLQHGLADSCRSQLDVGLAFQHETEAREPGQDLFREHRLQLVRGPRHHAQHLAVLLHPQPGGRSIGVGQDLPPLETKGLLEVVGGHLAPEQCKALQDVPLNLGIEHELLRKHERPGLSGAVVAGRPQAPGDENDVGALPAFPELPCNVLRIIRYRHIPAQAYAARAKL